MVMGCYVIRYAGQDDWPRGAGKSGWGTAVSDPMEIGKKGGQRRKE
jgi:hypothetical protein